VTAINELILTATEVTSSITPQENPKYLPNSTHVRDQRQMGSHVTWADSHNKIVSTKISAIITVANKRGQ